MRKIQKSLRQEIGTSEREVKQINLAVKFVRIRDQHDRDALRLRVHTGSRDSQEDAASNEESNNSSEAVD